MLRLENFLTMTLLNGGVLSVEEINEAMRLLQLINEAKLKSPLDWELSYAFRHEKRA